MYQRKLNILIVSILCLLSTFALAMDGINTLRPIKAQLKPVMYFENEATFVLSLNIPSNWKVYSNEPGDTGLPFNIKITSTDNVLNSRFVWPKPEILIESFGLETIKTNIYKSSVSIPIVIKTSNANSPLNIQIEAVFGACESICIKQEERLSASIEPEFYDDLEYMQIEHLFTDTETSLLMMLCFAFVGGLILNLMPCVLPILSIKVMGILKYSSLNTLTIRLNLLFTGLGIVFSFLVLAVITLILKNSGELIGWGFHFQHPIFIMLMIVLIMLFALDMLGRIQFSLPHYIMQLFAFTANKEGYYGSFLTGALATLLATPCTASFLTVSVAFALTQGGLMIVLIYLMIGLGMSIPYLLLIVFPELLTFLPKPGAWMDKFKKILGFILILTAAWLYYVLFTLTYLRTTLIFTGCIILLRFVLTDLFKSTALWLRVVIIATALVSSLLLPYWMTSSIDLEKKMSEDIWQNFSEAQIDEIVASNKVVLVDVTASWCITCKFNKFLVLEQPGLLRKLIDDHVVLMRADFTNNDPKVYKFLEKNQHQGVPLNMVFGPHAKNGIILPILLTKEEILNAIAQAK